MRNTTFWCIALLAGCSPATTLVAQGSSDDTKPRSVPLSSIQLSTAPAFALLGIAPSAVQRPNTPQRFLASVVSASGTDNIIPDATALETTPYWWLSHPALTIEQYYGERNLLRRAVRSASFSFATTRLKATSDTVRADSRVAGAVRTLLFDGDPSPELVAIRDSLHQLQLFLLNKQEFDFPPLQARADSLAIRERALEEERNTAREATARFVLTNDSVFRRQAETAFANLPGLQDAVTAALQARALLERDRPAVDAAHKAIRDLATRFQAASKEPTGFVVELAGGVAATFSQSLWDKASKPVFGIWLTPMYRWSQPDIEIIAVGRLLTNNQDFAGRDLLDAGGRLNLHRGRVSLSGEYTVRTLLGEPSMVTVPTATPSESSARWAALFNFKLSDQLHLVGSFGSDYRRSAGDRPMMATFGLNLGIGGIELTSDK